MKNVHQSLLVIIITICFSVFNTIKAEGWKLIWADEFNYVGLPDSTKWGYDVGGNGWGNDESQYYTFKKLENARVENGVLIIEAHKQAVDSKNYSSARLISKGKGDWTYGRFDIKARLPKGRGTWPAIWMLPTVWNYGNGGWPDNGEIDIMEHVGFHHGYIHGSIHCHSYYWKNNTQKTDTTIVSDASEAFHIYSLEWNADSIKTLVDNKVFFVATNDNSGWQGWPFNKDFHLLLNLAVGGAWGGAKGIDDTIFPQRMEIDYVRVYQK